MMTPDKEPREMIGQTPGADAAEDTDKLRPAPNTDCLLITFADPAVGQTIYEPEEFDDFAIIGGLTLKIMKGCKTVAAYNMNHILSVHRADLEAVNDFLADDNNVTITSDDGPDLELQADEVGVIWSEDADQARYDFLAELALMLKHNGWTADHIYVCADGLKQVGNGDEGDDVE